MASFAEQIARYAGQDPLDPDTFLQEMWAYLSPSQQEMFSAMLAQPTNVRRDVAIQGGQGNLIDAMTEAANKSPIKPVEKKGAAPADRAEVPAAEQIREAQRQAQQRTAQGAALAPNSGVAITTPLPNIGPLGSAPNLKQPAMQLAKTPGGQAQVQIEGGGVMPTNAAIANVQTTGAGASTATSLSNWAVKNGFNLAPYDDDKPAATSPAPAAPTPTPAAQPAQSLASAVTAAGKAAGVASGTRIKLRTGEWITLGGD